jgi:hypothetical protein
MCTLRWPRYSPRLLSYHVGWSEIEWTMERRLFVMQSAGQSSYNLLLRCSRTQLETGMTIAWCITYVRKCSFNFVLRKTNDTPIHRNPQLSKFVRTSFVSFVPMSKIFGPVANCAILCVKNRGTFPLYVRVSNWSITFKLNCCMYRLTKLNFSYLLFDIAIVMS